MINLSDRLNVNACNPDFKYAKRADGTPWGSVSEFQEAMDTELIDIPLRTTILVNINGVPTEMWNRDNVNQYVVKQSNSYTKTESDNKYQLKGNYLTESVGDSKYQPAGSYLTEYESDSKYQPKGSYLTETQSDARYQPKGSYVGSSELSNYQTVSGMPVGSENGNNQGPDFYVTDESGNAIAAFEGGHIRTKNFNSAEVYSKAQCDARYAPSSVVGDINTILESIVGGD